MSKEIQKKISYSEYTEADKFIRYWLNPGDTSIELTDTEKKRLDMIRIIHGLRTNYGSKKEIREILFSVHGIKERQAYNLINLTEEVLGKVEGVNKAYLRNFLLDKAIKNIEMAAKSRSSMALTKALLAAYKIGGLEEFIPEMPDFASLEQHKYVLNLPENLKEALKELVKTGRLKLSELLPPPNINLIHTDEAQEVKDDSDPS